MLTTNLSGYPRRPDLNSIRKYLAIGGENPYTIATKKAVREQMEAGVDVITDGQVRDVLNVMASNVPGMEAACPRPRIENKLGAPRQPTVAPDFVVATELCGDARRVKAALPGPFSFAESCEIDPKSGYGSKFDAELLFDIASVLRFEIEALRAHKARLIQIAEPIESVHDFAIFADLLSLMFKKVAMPICHMEGNMRRAFPMLLDSKVAVISFEVVKFPENRRVLEFEELVTANEKRTCVGCVNSSPEPQETLELVEKRIIPFVEAFGYDLVWISTNGTLANLSFKEAFHRLRQLKITKERIAVKNR
jgi:5-methyltetrahydropteroyltriglutamate--homocysteine methyltransferase